MRRSIRKKNQVRFYTAPWVIERIAPLVLASLTVVALLAAIVYVTYRAFMTNAPPVETNLPWRLLAGAVGVVIAALTLLAIRAYRRSPGIVHALLASRIQSRSLFAKPDVLEQWDTHDREESVETLRALASNFKEKLVTTTGPLDGLVMTQEMFAADIGQKVLDQTTVQRDRDPRIRASRCETWPFRPFIAEKDGQMSPREVNFTELPVATREELIAWVGRAFNEAPVRRDPEVAPTPGRGGGIGNPRMPPLVDVWFELPVYPGAPGDSAVFHLHGVLAPLRGQPGRPCPPLVVIVPGVFDSVEQHYIRDTIAVIHEMGCSALALDMRSHGDTRRLASALQRPVEASFGLFEGQDIVGILDQLADHETSTHFGDVFLVGFSGGGRNVLRAVEELARSRTTTTRGIRLGQRSQRRQLRNALAVCPPLDFTDTLGRILPVFGEFFAELAARRKLQPEARDSALDQLIHDSFKSYATGGYIADEALKAKIAQDVHAELARMPFALSADRRGRAAKSELPLDALLTAVRHSTVLYAKDDPVVSHKQYDRHLRILQKLLASQTTKQTGSATELLDAHLIGSDKGGHCAFVIASQALTREWFYRWMRLYSSDAVSAPRAQPRQAKVFVHEGSSSAPSPAAGNHDTAATKMSR